MRLFSFNTPNTPPTAKEDDLAYLRLIRSRRVGPATFHRMIAEYGSAAEALLQLPEIAKAAGITDYEPCPAHIAKRELDAGRKAGATLLRYDSEAYPEQLRAIPDAPPVLWVKGNLAALSAPQIAVIGARNASSLGLRMARGLAGDLAEAGYLVTAGLARGIDTAAHEAALKTGTIAVLAGGIDKIYPRENEVLAANLCQNGALISEQPPGTEPTPQHFPPRNRIISGIAHGVVVIEAAARSGSLITAKTALDQGREVMAVPGHPIDQRASGCNALLRDGATLVRHAQDVIEVLEAAGHFASPPSDHSPVPAPRAEALTAAGKNASRQPAHVKQRADIGALHARKLASVETAGAATRNKGGPVALDQRLLARLSPTPTDEHILLRDLGVAPSTLSVALTRLEVEGRIQRLPGAKIALA